MNKKVECSYQRCHKRATDTGRCKSHEKKHKDEVFAAGIRGKGNGHCMSRFGSGYFDAIECNGNLQCAHIISRSYLRTRWDPDNAVPLCAAHHTYYTHHPQEWIEWCMANGIDYWALHQRALGIPA